MAMYACICPNCGLVLQLSDTNHRSEKCDCGEANFTSLGVYPADYYKLSEDKQQQLIQKTLNLTDQQFKEQKEIWEKIREPIRKRYEEERQARAQRNREIEMRNRVTCPYCNSFDVSKISTFSRSASVSLFGLASNKIGKQWHCNHCKSDF
ncbi:MAG: hypothetical protein K2N72_02310 [Oscillospiraceae bacterium]|nr:hypothetical protein [Oscillospiraceae bacterium]